MLPVVLPKADIDRLMEAASRGANAVFTVDLEKQEITDPDGKPIHFEIDAFRKHCLLNGLDDIGLTLEKAPAIENFEQAARRARPWQYP